MNKYRNTTEIKNDEILRASFNSLAHQTFNIDFEKWYQKGYWGNSYTCHTIIKDNQVLSNVSTTEMSLRINGKIVSAVQIGTVMTLPEYKKMGLASELMNLVTEKFKSTTDLLFLFPNESVMRFYPKFGYDLTCDYKYSKQIKRNSKQVIDLEKLNIDNPVDLNKIYTYAKNRVPLSREFETLNSESILMWYCINVFSQNIYYAKEYDCIVIFEVSENSINLFDIVTLKKFNVNDLIDQISTESTEIVNFHFMPELENGQENQYKIEKNEMIFTKQNSLFSNSKIAYPVTAHT